MDNTNEFNHALYHLVRHWTAVVVIIGWLLTVGMMIETTTNPIPLPSKKIFYFGILVTTGMAIYFLIRMYTFGKWINARLSEDYVKEVISNRILDSLNRFIGDSLTLFIGGALVICIALVTYVLCKQS